MSAYVLVHGAFHGGWCWYKVVTRLAERGHIVYAPDLAGVGRDTTAIAEVSLARWADDICQIVDRLDEPVILVGHSRAGIVISEAAERRPGKIAMLVYVTALLLRDGETLAATLRSDETSRIVPNVIVADDGLSMTIRPEAIRDVFYSTSPEEDVVLAKTLLGPEPRGPSATSIHVTEERFGGVPRVYVECLRDQAIPIGLQRRMHARLPCAQVCSLDTDHSPFFSAPDALADFLMSLSAGGPA
jgi:pimeloyl-ACP methyl ester carboxylesterase